MQLDHSKNHEPKQSLCYDVRRPGTIERCCMRSLHTHIVTVVADASSGSLSKNQKVHFCLDGAGAAQGLPAPIGGLPWVGVPDRCVKVGRGGGVRRTELGSTSKSSKGNMILLVMTLPTLASWLKSANCFPFMYPHHSKHCTWIKMDTSHRWSFKTNKKQSATCATKND